MAEIKKFDDELLYIIRDTFADMCWNHIENGNRFDAQEELDIINTVQEQLEEDGYKDLAHFLLNTSGTWGDIEERDMTDKEEAAVRAMVEWATTTDKVTPSPKLQRAVDEYLNEQGADDNIHTPEEKVKIRSQLINQLIVLCMRECPDVVSKLDDIKKQMAENPSGLPSQFHDLAESMYYKLRGKSESIVLTKEADSMGILMVAGSTQQGLCRLHGDMTAVKALIRERMINDDAFFSLVKSSVAYVSDYREKHNINNTLEEDEI